MLLPPEIVDHIIDFVDDNRSLQACSLVAKSWVDRSRVYLFRDVALFSHRQWQKVMPTGITSPARYTRSLALVHGNTPRGRWITTDNLYPFLAHLRDFRNVENLTLDGWVPSVFSEGGLKKYFGHFGENLRSLVLGGERMSPDSFLVLLGLLPNLEDLSVKECIEGSKTGRVPTVSPKLSGRLTIRVHTKSLFPTLCKLPLRFQEIRLQEHLHDYQELINACAETLVDFRAMPPDFGRPRHRFFILYLDLTPSPSDHEISFQECKELVELTLVKRSIERPTQDIMAIFSTITSKHIRQITIGFMNPVTDTQLVSMVEHKTWEKFDEAIARLAEQTSNNGRKLQLKLHVCGDASIGSFNFLFPRFVESGRFMVVKASYIWNGSISRSIS